MKVYLLTILSLIFSYFCQKDLDPCTLSDIGYFITDCINNKRNVYLYWKNQCDILHDDSIILPASKFNIDCGSCGKGQYLKYSPQTDKLGCDFCPENTYSLGGAFRISGILREWKESNEFYKMISDKSCFVASRQGVDCTSWVPSEDKTYLYAGETQVDEDSEYVAKFSISVNLIKHGKISFKYKKAGTSKNLDSAELVFYINYISYLNIKLNDDNWNVATFNLIPGVYTFGWEFIKYVSRGVEVSKEILAAIEMIEIEGLETGDLACKKCIHSTSEAGSSECQFCKENHYYDEITNNCIECDESKYSLHNSIGISSCKTRKPCTNYDYQSILDDKCLYSNSLQLKRYEWINPMLCHQDSGVKLPLDTYEKCDSCDKGEYVLKSAIDNITTYTCEKCPLGTYRNETMPNTHCIKCEDGLYPINILKLKNFKLKTIEKYITNVGWTVQNDILIPDPRHKGFSHILEKNILVKENSGRIIINYKIRENLGPEEYFLITHEGKQSSSKYNLVKAGNFDLEINLDRDLNLFKVEYHRPYKIFDPENIEPPKVNLISFTFLNTTEGGGYTCNDCEDGYFDPQLKECKKCPYGTELNLLTKTSCLICLEGYFNDGTFSRCKKCPEFTKSIGRSCVLNDVLKSTNNSLRYVVKNLSTRATNNNHEKFIGPIIDKNDSSIYFISHKEKTIFTNYDFSYTEHNNHIRDGHIFGLKKMNDFDQKVSVNQTIFDHTKLIINYGSTIDYVKLIKNYTGGILIKYKDGDSCAHEHGKRYSSYLIITCEKKNTLSQLLSLPKIVKNLNISKCEKVFQWKTKYGCRNCLKNELFPILTPCKKSKRMRSYTENEICTIQNPANLTGDLYDYDDDKLIINLVNISNQTVEMNIEDTLKEYFGMRKLQINNNSIFNSTNDESRVDIFIDYARHTEKCRFLDDLEDFIFIIIVVPITYCLVGVFAFICYLKYRKIRNNYMMLKDERDSNSVITKKNQSQLEMSRTDRNIEKIEEVKKDEKKEEKIKEKIEEKKEEVPIA